MADEHYLTYKVILGVFVTIFLSVAGYFATSTFTKLTEIQKELVSIQLQISELNLKSEKNFILLNGKILTKEEVRGIAQEEINKHFIEHHHK